MTELLDGTKVPWHIVSGKTEPETPTRSSLPPPVRRVAYTAEEITAATANVHVMIRAFANMPAALRRATDAMRRLTHAMQEDS